MQQRVIKKLQQIQKSCRIFAEKGFSGITVNEIAQTAAVSESTLISVPSRSFSRPPAAGQIRPVDFHTYLFTLLAVSYFYVPNRKTLIHTLGGELFSDGDGGRLCEQLGNVFQP